jgi:signal recognition particle receptor subunit beta
MALINHRAREIHFKIVYYGPGLGGKTTNLQILYERLPPERRGRLISVATDHERTLFFDFLPVELGTINGLLTRFHLYTVPGQVYYRLSRRAVLQGADGIVFVADSHPAREQANRESLADMTEHLATLGLEGAGRRRLPRVFQYNKRDLPLALSVERLRAALNPEGAPDFEAIAREGRGVTETLRASCKQVLARLAGDVAPASVGAATTGAAGSAAVRAASAPGAGAARPGVTAPVAPGAGAVPGAAGSSRVPGPPPGAGATAPGHVAGAPPRPAPRAIA